MKKLVLFLLFLPLVFHGENNISIVGSIGGTVNTSTFGGAIYSIPLEIPKGVCNMQPEIGIIYNSQGGNGLLGYGWNISCFHNNQNRFHVIPQWKDDRCRLQW